MSEDQSMQYTNNLDPYPHNTSQQLPLQKESAGRLWVKINTLPKTATILLLTIISFMLVSLVFVLIGASQTNPKRIVKNYVSARINRDWETMFGYLDLENSVFLNKDSFAKMMGDEGKPEIVSCEISGVPGLRQPGAYTVNYFLAADPFAEEEVVTLVKQSGKRYLFYNNYKISADNIIVTDYQVHILPGATAYIDGIRLVNYGESILHLGKYNYYTIPVLFRGNHTLTVEHPECDPYLYQMQLNAFSAKYSVISTLPIKGLVKTNLAQKANDLFRQLLVSSFDNNNIDNLSLPHAKDNSATSQLCAAYDYLRSQMITNEDGTGVKEIAISGVADKSSQNYLQASNSYLCELLISYYYTVVSKTFSGELYEETSQGEACIQISYEYNGEWVLSDINLGDFDIFYASGYTVIVPFGKYSWITDFNDGFAVVNDSGKMGLINEKGAEIVPVGIYDEISYYHYGHDDYYGVFYSEGMIAVSVDGKWGFLDEAGREIIPCKYDYVDNFSKGLAKVRIGDEETGKWGFIDINGKEIIPCKYDAVTNFSEGLAEVRIGDWETGKWGFIDINGKEIIPCKYDYVYNFSEGLAEVRIGDRETGKWGFIDPEGKEAVPCKYDYVDGFSEGLAKVRIGDWKTGKWGFIDKSGEETIPCTYDDVNSFSEGLAKVRIGDEETGKWGFIDINGKEIIPCKYNAVYNFSEGLTKVRIGDEETGKWGFIDKSGEEIIPCKYNYIESFVNNLTMGEVGNKDSGKWESICVSNNSTDDVVEVFIGSTYRSDFMLRYDIVYDAGEWGLYDRSGKEIVPCQYNKMYPLAKSRWLVSIGDQWSIIDSAGKEVKSFVYDYIDPFNEYIIRVSLNDKWGIIDDTGKEIVSLMYDGMRPLYYNDYSGYYRYMAVLRGEWGSNNWGVINNAGEEIVPCQFDEIEYCYKNYALVSRNGKWGIIAIE